MSLMIGRTIGNYKVTAEIGRGGMGAVYLAEHPIIGRRVAIKLLHGRHDQNPQVIARFFKEAKAAHQINNPHIVEVFDFGGARGGALSHHGVALRADPGGVHA